MIRMKKLRSSGIQGSNEGYVARGREFMAPSEDRAKELEDAGLAYRIDSKMEDVAPLNKMEPPPSNKAAQTGPLGSVGGTTGAEAPAPSSPPDQVQRRRRSARSRDEDLL